MPEAAPVTSATRRANLTPVDPRAGALRLLADRAPPAARLARRRAPRLLGRAEHRALRARATVDEPLRRHRDAEAGPAQLWLARLRPARRSLAHDRAARPPGDASERAP